MALEILLFSKVLLEDGSEGIVKYVGDILGKKGTFYGIDITKGSGKNYGIFKNIKYFDTKKGGKTGRFVKKSKIKQSIKTSNTKYNYEINETVICTKTKCKGSIKYMGVPEWNKSGKTVYFGLELHEQYGTCNGTIKGTQYFKTKMLYGIYVTSIDIKKLKVKSPTNPVSVEHIRAIIGGLIEKHEPDKIDEIVVLMRKWKGKENELLKSLCKSYKEKYTKMRGKIFNKQYIIGSKIGTGNFSVIRKCKRRSDGKLFALKIINKKNMDKFEWICLENAYSLKRRVCDHPNIIKCHDFFENNSKLLIIEDFCEGGELFNYIIKRGKISEHGAKLIFYQLCKAVEYMHSEHIAKRAISPENILFVKKNDRSIIKLGGFRLAGSFKYGLLRTPCGVPPYVAPEIIRRYDYDGQVDMWSLGCILYIMLCGFPPFYDELDRLNELYLKIKRAEYDMPSPYWDNITMSAKDLVRKLLKVDPKKRLTAKMALQHPWFKIVVLISGYIRQTSNIDSLHVFAIDIIVKYCFG